MLILHFSIGARDPPGVSCCIEDPPIASNLMANPMSDEENSDEEISEEEIPFVGDVMVVGPGKEEKEEIAIATGLATAPPPGKRLWMKL